MAKKERVNRNGKNAWKIPTDFGLGGTSIPVPCQCISEVRCKDRKGSLHGISSPD